MDFVDQFTFYIALKIMEVDLGKALFKIFKVVFKGFASVDFRLSFSQEIEIWAVDDLNGQGKIGLKLESKLTSFMKVPTTVNLLLLRTFLDAE